MPKKSLKQLRSMMQDNPQKVANILEKRLSGPKSASKPTLARATVQVKKLPIKTQKNLSQAKKGGSGKQATLSPKPVRKIKTPIKIVQHVPSKMQPAFKKTPSPLRNAIKKTRLAKPRGKGIVKALGQQGTTGNFAQIEAAQGPGAAIAALQNRLSNKRGQPIPFISHKKKKSPMKACKKKLR